MANIAVGFGLIICRVGAWVMLAPGFSSPRIPMPVRMLLAVSMSIALFPLIFTEASTSPDLVSPAALLSAVGSELLIGGSLGVAARLLVLALQFSATLIGTLIGLSGIPGVPMEDAESPSPLASLISMSAILVLLAAGFHMWALRAIVESFTVNPPGNVIAFRFDLDELVRTVTVGFRLALQLAAPVVLYCIVVNVSIGLANRFAPQLSVFHATTGLVMIGGLVLFAFYVVDGVMLFTGGVESWMTR